jgi:hypothetical protein
MKYQVMPRDPTRDPFYRVHGSACFCRYLLTGLSDNDEYYFCKSNGICGTGNRWNADYSFIVNTRLSNAVYCNKSDLVTFR